MKLKNYSMEIVNYHANTKDDWLVNVPHRNFALTLIIHGKKKCVYRLL